MLSSPAVCTMLQGSEIYILYLHEKNATFCFCPNFAWQAQSPSDKTLPGD